VKGPPVFAVDVLNFAIVTYAVPAERVLRHLPKVYELDTFEGPDGQRALVSTTCFCNQDFRLAGVPQPRHTFNESTYRTYVSRDGEKGVYFFGRYLGTRLAWSLQRPVARHTYEADIEVDVQRTPEGYASYGCSARSRSGATNFSVEAMDVPSAKSPFASGEELAQFITYRLHGFFTSTAGFQGHMPVGHPRMRPLAGTLSAARFDLWSQLGVLRPDEVDDPYSVLVVPEVPFRLFAARPVGRDEDADEAPRHGKARKEASAAGTPKR
jgi:uncharacterized protein YqjF (DUF2071 family)